MSDDSLSDLPAKTTAPPADGRTLWSSSLYRVFEELINLRERNDREHRVFKQTLAESRDAIQSGFNSFAADTHRAYQQLRQEINAEKRISLTLLNELLEIGMELEHIAQARPKTEDEAMSAWAGSVEVEARKVQAALRRYGIHPYDAVIGSAYNPAMHERVGSKRAEGMDAHRVAEQRERGYASQAPEFVLRRPKVIVSE